MELVLWANGFAAIVATGTNLRAAYLMRGWLSAVFLITAALSMVFGLFYLWLAHGDQSPHDLAFFGNVLRPFSLFAWLTPWIGMSLALPATSRRDARRILSKADRAMKAAQHVGVV